MNTKSPLPTAPNTFTQRVMRRRALKSLAKDKLFEVGLPADTLGKPDEKDPLIAIGLEELVARLILANLPDAHTFQIVEDTSHDAPHGHVGKVFDEHRILLADGFNDDWHAMDWTHEADEAAYDFHHYAKALFVEKDAEGRNMVLIPTRVI